MNSGRIYQRFTDRARKVMLLANQDAIRFNCEHVETEHILLGLLGEGSGVAIAVLNNFKVDLTAIREEAERSVQTGTDNTAGKRPQSQSARRVMEYAAEEQRHLRHHYLDTEHLLLGLLREQNGGAARILHILGLNPDEVRGEVMRVLGYVWPRPDDASTPSPH